MDVYADYLRKSRADEQAEARGEGDALARHRKTLTELAAHEGYTIVKEYAEVASGDSLAARPQAQQLLLDVMAGKYTGVLCIDLDRLSRGAAEDQATIIKAFQVGDCKIITPGRIYDFNNPADEDFGELKLMFARMEYKSIKRKMYAGRERSAKDGCYIGARKVYGYHKVPAQGKDGPTLAVYPEQAAVVLDIFQMCADGKTSYQIADALNARGIKPNYSDHWSTSTIRQMLKNPVYIGQITWGKRVKRAVVGPDGVKRVKNQRAIISQGKHPPIIPEPLWASVAAIMAGHAAPTVKPGRPLENPLAGLIRCARCGYVMQRQQDKTRPDLLRCHNRQCDQIRGDLKMVERLILEYLDQQFTPSAGLDFAQNQRNQERQRAAKLLRDQIKQAEAQQGRLADLLEQGIYSVEDFVGRRNVLSERLLGLRRQLAEVTEPDAVQERLAELRKIIPPSMTVSEAYAMATTNEQKNQLLKSLLDRVEYDKTEKRRGKYDDPARGLTLEFKLLF